jgi:anthranilate synthase component 1
MRIEPALDAFAAAHAAGVPQVVWTRIVADLETPVGAYLKLAGRGGPGFLLESVEGGAVRGRYSILGFEPDLIFRARGDAPEINRTPADPAGFAPVAGGTLSAMRALLDESRIALPEGLPPMAAGVFGYLAYDTIRLVERIGAEKPDPIGVPDALFVRPMLVVVFDAVKDEITLVTPVRPKAGESASTAHARAVERLTAALDALDGPVAKDLGAAPDLVAGAAVSNTTPEAYVDMVARAKEYIAAGDAFQIVLSQRFSTPFTLPPFALYRTLRRVNPSPFLFFLDFNDFALVGSSPEILVRVRDGEVTIRPIAGTSPRGATPAEDKANGERLLLDPKERAEHLMLLDLGRNDVGRVAEIGSVKVTDSFFLERYSHVMHIVSNVTGRLAGGKDVIDALLGGFPAGTVSGAPKVRAMQIINELEAEKRGVYAGCVGYFSATGEMDTCIVLRTALVKDGVMYVQAGAGIVADSVPASEQAECVAKARALFRAAEEAVRFAAGARRGQ